VTDTVPRGVHPGDPSWPPAEPHPHSEPAQTYSTTREPFAVENGFAVAVYQRAGKRWRGYSYQVPAAAGNTLQLAGELVGRVAVSILVGSASAGSLLVNSDRGLVDGGQGVLLGPGGSMTIPTEDSVYGLGVGGTAAVSVMDIFNPQVVYPE
jgi:hypothetical protein